MSDPAGRRRTGKDVGRGKSQASPARAGRPTPQHPEPGCASPHTSKPKWHEEVRRVLVASPGVPLTGAGIARAIISRQQGSPDDYQRYRYVQRVVGVVLTRFRDRGLDIGEGWMLVSAEKRGRAARYLVERRPVDSAWTAA